MQNNNTIDVCREYWVPRTKTSCDNVSSLDDAFYLDTLLMTYCWHFEPLVFDTKDVFRIRTIWRNVIWGINILICGLVYGSSFRYSHELSRSSELVAGRTEWSTERNATTLWPKVWPRTLKNHIKNSRFRKKLSWRNTCCDHFEAT